MTIRCGKRGESAGTLVEVILATCILSILSAGFMGSTNYGLFMMRLARENQRATQILLEKTEAIRLYNWDQVTNAGFIPTNFTAYYDPQTTNNPGVVYNGTMSILTPAFNPGPAPSYANNMREFSITLTWTTFGRINHTRTLTTYVAKDGIQNYVY
ncbi:MAG TPA: hypothetical protein VN578_15740 [Candidatus Binatia bacterium]|jgi:type II secretory pathway pseudopilin PulG|nr:hypothetical protein [Candidatus Binatia bacterium]